MTVHPGMRRDSGKIIHRNGGKAGVNHLIQGWVQSGGPGTDQSCFSTTRSTRKKTEPFGPGNGNLDFTSDDGSIKGTIQINGWNGATFEVTETIGAVPFSVGEKFEFPFAFQSKRW